MNKEKDNKDTIIIILLIIILVFVALNANLISNNRDGIINTNIRIDRLTNKK